MRHLITTTALHLLALAPLSVADVLHVRADAPPGGDGLSWSSAHADLVDALEHAAASDGAFDEIWVAAGTYRPDGGSGARFRSFELVSGVTLLGGFAGGERNAEQRDPDLHPTILSGDLAGDDGPGFAGNAENSYHVLSALGLDQPSVVDGFTIAGGNASGSVAYGRGGGAFVLLSDVWFVDCVLTDNSAGRGGAVAATAATLSLVGCSVALNQGSNYAGGIDASGSTVLVSGSDLTRNTGGSRAGISIADGVLLVTESAFIENAAAGGYGACLHAEGAVVVLDGCEVRANRVLATTGGGVAAHVGPFAIPGGGLKASSFTATGCLFERHVSNGGFGGALSIDAPATLASCVFRLNSAEAGGAVRLSGNHARVVTSCVFDRNTANGYGGGLSASQGTIKLEATSFDRNYCRSTQPSGGAGCELSVASATVQSCDFVHNIANSSGGTGGGLLLVAGSSTVTGCVFLFNEAHQGGGLHLTDGAGPAVVALVEGCWFEGNWAASTGGAVRVQSSNLALADSTMLANSAVTAGGALGSSGSLIAVAGCTIAENEAGPSASAAGGGLSIESGSLVMANSLLERNGAGLGGGLRLAFGAQGSLANGRVVGNVGGGLRIDEGADATIDSCTIVSNAVAGSGDGILVTKAGSSASIRNSILWGNGDGSEASQISAGAGAVATLTSSCVQGWSGVLGGTGNLGLDPEFVSLLGPDNLAGSGDEDLHLGDGSPCIDSGDAVLLPADLLDLDGNGDVEEPLPIDLDGAPRVQGAVDRGCYERMKMDSREWHEANGMRSRRAFGSGFAAW